MQNDDRDLNAIETEEQSQVATDEETTVEQVQAEAETDSATQSEDTIDTAEKTSKRRDRAYFSSTPTRR